MSAKTLGVLFLITFAAILNLVAGYYLGRGVLEVGVVPVFEAIILGIVWVVVLINTFADC